LRQNLFRCNAVKPSKYEQRWLKLISQKRFRLTHFDGRTANSRFEAEQTAECWQIIGHPHHTLVAQGETRRRCGNLEKYSDLLE